MPGQKIETGHQDVVHDVAMDYYGKRLATASSDNTIKIIGVSNSGSQHLATLTGHQGPVWQVAWAHPKFGSLLASCSYDGKLDLERRQSNEWIQAHVFDDHKKILSWVLELGLCLAWIRGTSRSMQDRWWMGQMSRIDQCSLAPSHAQLLFCSSPLDPVQKLAWWL
ncbi:UNVERIFIED_CONTAM: protein transport protein SEC13A [Sesamum angustifolium]|uniref:Protein transport protein SEC13A n=1 Tax=Sesamum angustifolium TaxID=2727405 RepID=A0AAW2LJJ4_9LAMI